MISGSMSLYHCCAYTRIIFSISIRLVILHVAVSNQGDEFFVSRVTNTYVWKKLRLSLVVKFFVFFVIYCSTHSVVLVIFLQLNCSILLIYLYSQSYQNKVQLLINHHESHRHWRCWMEIINSSFTWTRWHVCILKHLTAQTPYFYFHFFIFMFYFVCIYIVFNNNN